MRTSRLTFTTGPATNFICQGLGRDFSRQFVKVSGIGKQLQALSGQSAAAAAGISALRNIVGGPVRFNFKENSAFARILKALEPITADYRQAQRRAGRRYGPVIAALEIPGEVGIVDLTAAFTALAAGNDAGLARLRRRLRARARRGDQQAAALENYLHLLLGLLHDERLRRLLLEARALVRALVRVDELADLAKLRTSTRASARRHRRPRVEQDPVRTRRAARAPNDVSSLSFPEVAA